MEIDWSKEEISAGYAGARKDPYGEKLVLSDAAVGHIMSAGVAAFLARATGQVKEDVAEIEATLIRSVSVPVMERAEDRKRLSRLQALAQEAESLRAKVAELESSPWAQKYLERETEIKEAWGLKRHWKAVADDATCERDALRAEVERLKAEKVGWATELEQRAATAESRLAAGRERAKDGDRMRREYITAYDADPNWQPYRAAVEACRAVARWVLEGDAPQEAKPRGPLVIGNDGAPVLVTREGLRYPCSPTCTHDDAATQGHPERVKARSEAVTADLNRAVERSEDWGAGYSEGHDVGADKMRAAVEKWACEYFGDVPPSLKAALDGAAP